MAVGETTEDLRGNNGDALARAAVRLRAWWDGNDPIDELAHMAEREGAAAPHPAMRDRLKAWWEGSDPWQPPATPDSARGSGAGKRAEAAGASAGPALKLPPARLETWTRLWGEGFSEPFDKSYVPDLVKPFALNEKMSVVDLGARLGGGTRAVAERYKVWITGMEPDPEYAAAAMQFSIKAGMKTKAPVVAYDIDKLSLPAKRTNCIYAMETFHRATSKKRLFQTIAQSLTDQGQFLFTDFVLKKAGERPADVAAWMRAEPFVTHPWSAEETKKALAELKFDTRIDEDMTPKYRRLALFGWQECLARLQKRPPRAMLLQLLDDAELWVLRLRAMESGALQVRRYFALKRG